MRTLPKLVLLPSIFVLSLLITCHSSPSTGNQQQPLSDRERDGLAGPVKAVLTDDVVLVEQNGQWFETQQASSVSIYDEAGKRTLQTPLRVSLPGGYAHLLHELLFDPQIKGREVEEKIPNGSDKWLKVYDSKGYVIARTRFDSNCNPIEKNQIIYEYDDRGNLIKRNITRSISGPAEASYRQFVYFDSSAETNQTLSAQASPVEIKSPIATNEVNVNAGRSLYNQKCIACHGENGKAQTEFSSVMVHKPKDLTSLEVRAHTETDIYSIISNGKKPRGMPAFKGRISDEALWQLTIYVKQFPASQNIPTATALPTPPLQKPSSVAIVPEQRYQFKGKIISIERDARQVTVEHEEIPGYMGAMTMPFPLSDEKVLNKLKKDDRIQATLVVDAKGWRLENVVIK